MLDSRGNWLNCSNIENQKKSFVCWQNNQNKNQFPLLDCHQLLQSRACWSLQKVFCNNSQNVPLFPRSPVVWLKPLFFLGAAKIEINLWRGAAAPEPPRGQIQCQLVGGYFFAVKSWHVPVPQIYNRELMWFWTDSTVCCGSELESGSAWFTFTNLETMAAVYETHHLVDMLSSQTVTFNHFNNEVTNRI